MVQGPAGSGERVAVVAGHDALDARRRRKRRCQPRQVAAFGVGVACEEDLEAEGVGAKHIMVRQLAGHEEGRALRRGRLEETRAAARADGEGAVHAG